MTLSQIFQAYGKEIWTDRDLYYMAAYGETCTVVESLKTEVLIYVPIMDSRYWFVVKEQFK